MPSRFFARPRMIVHNYYIYYIMVRRSSSGIVTPRRSGAAVEGITMLKHGAPAIKYSTKDRPKRTLFHLNAEETTLSWGGTALGQVLHKHRGETRSVKLDEILELHVGGAATKEDLLALERTEGFGSLHAPSARMSERRSVAARFSERFSTRAEKSELPRLSAAGISSRLSVATPRLSMAMRPSTAGVPQPADQSHLRITLVLIGSLPMPPSLDDEEGAPTPLVASMRKSLALQCMDEDSLGLWLAALRTLLAERQPPSPIGPAAIMSSFGCPLEEAALADASVGSSSKKLLIPAVLEALWHALATRDDGLTTEGIFRLSAAGSELAEVRRRIQEADGSEQALKEASTCCLAALIKLYLRELPGELWSPVRAQIVRLLDAPLPPPRAGLAASIFGSRRSSSLSIGALTRRSLRALSVSSSNIDDQATTDDTSAGRANGGSDGGGGGGGDNMGAVAGGGAGGVLVLVGLAAFIHFKVRQLT